MRSSIRIRIGVLLFIIYTNDLPDTLNLLKSIIFADDATLCYSSPNIQHLSETMNRELDSLTDWFPANQLSLNVSKTNYMLFANIKPQQHYIEIKLTNTIIAKTNCVKFLDVFIDVRMCVYIYMYFPNSLLLAALSEWCLVHPR
jgi:hypothetical protein